MGINPSWFHQKQISNGDPGRNLDSKKISNKVFFSVGIKTGKQVDRSIELHLSQQDASQHLGLCNGRWVPDSYPIMQEACWAGDQRQKLRREDGQNNCGKERQGLPVAPLGAHQQHELLQPCTGSSSSWILPAILQHASSGTLRPRLCVVLKCRA